MFWECATKGQRYDKSGIIQLLIDEKVFDKIEYRVHMNSFFITTEENIDIYIPDAVWNGYLRGHNNIDNEENQMYYRKVKKRNLKN